MTRVTLHGGPKDGWVYDVEGEPAVIRTSSFDANDPRKPIEQARDPENLAGVYLRRGESTDYDWRSDR